MFPTDIDWKTVNYLRISTDNAGENYQELNEFAQKIKNLNGLDKLPNLETLQCYQLTGLKGKTTLKNSSTLSVINIGNCGESTSNTAPESGLDSSPESNTDFSLELSDLPGLEFLTVISNPGLNSLSITGNNEMLTNLTIQNQPKLSVFDPKDLSNLETFYCIGTSIEALTLNTNTKIIDLNCSNSKLKSLDLTSNPSLSTLDCSDNSSLVSLKLNAETNKWLYSLDCSNTQIDSLNLEGFESLHEVKCNYCKELWTATVKNCPELYSFSNTSTPALRNLNVRGCPRLNKKSIARNENLTIEDDPVETKYDYTVKGIEDSYWQTGSAIEPKPVLKYGTYTLKEGKDYKLSYKNNVDGPKGSVTITGKGVFGGVNKTVYFKIEKTDRMNRLYNPNSGEHFYTASTAEKNHLVKLGWRSEGIGWTTPKTSKTPVYRLYNPNAGDHHYTMSLAEKDMLVSKGWRYEGIAFYSGDSDGVAVYRQYNPNAKAGAHNYTSSFGEHKYLINVGWNGEGVAWYGVSND